MIKCTFYAQDDSKNIYVAKVRSLEVADSIRNNLMYIGGFTRFDMDVWGETNENLPVVPCNRRGFKMIYKSLYGNIPV